MDFPARQMTQPIGRPWEHVHTPVKPSHVIWSHSLSNYDWITQDIFTTSVNSICAAWHVSCFHPFSIMNKRGFTLSIFRETESTERCRRKPQEQVELVRMPLGKGKNRIFKDMLYPWFIPPTQWDTSTRSVYAQNTNCGWKGDRSKGHAVLTLLPNVLQRV